MPELKELLERERDRLRLPPGSLEALRRRRHRRRRARQLGSGLLALAVAAAGAWGAYAAFGRGPARPAVTLPTAPTPTASPSVTPSPTPPATTAPPPAGAALPGRPAGPLWFVDEDRGWAVVAGDVFATDDGGSSWSLQYGGPAQVSALQFVDATHGWAVSSEGLLRTQDGGATWEALAGTGEVRAVQFASADLGWAVLSGGAGALARTEDGGLTWEGVTVPGPAETLCVARGAAGPTLWVAGASPRSGPAGGVVLRSTDGGSSWQPVALSLREGWALELGCVDDAAWVLATDGGAAGHQAFGLLRVGGGSAAPVLQEPGTHPFGADGVPPAAGPYAGPLVALDPEAARFVTWCPPCEGGPTVMLTDDGGATWRTVQLPGDLGSVDVPVGMSFLDRDRGWLLLRREGTSPPGLLTFRTADGGLTWTEA